MQFLSQNLSWKLLNNQKIEYMYIQDPRDVNTERGRHASMYCFCLWLKCKRFTKKTNDLDWQESFEIYWIKQLRNVPIYNWRTRGGEVGIIWPLQPATLQKYPTHQMGFIRSKDNQVSVKAFLQLTFSLLSVTSIKCSWMLLFWLFANKSCQTTWRPASWAGDWPISLKWGKIGTKLMVNGENAALLIGLRNGQYT